MGCLELALPAADGAREGALLVAEELRLEQRLGQRGARHGHERPRAPRALDVDGPREELLARAALALDEDGRVAPRGHAGEIEDRVHLRTVAQEIAEAVLALEHLPEEDVLPRQGLLRDDLLREEAQLLRVEGLDQIVERAHLHRGHGRVHRGVGGHDDHHRVGPELPRLLQDPEAVHPRHLEVHEEDRPRLGPEALHRRGPVRSRRDGVPVLLEPARHRLPDDLFVVHHQDPRLPVIHGVPRPLAETPRGGSGSRDTGRRPWHPPAGRSPSAPSRSGGRRSG